MRSQFVGEQLISLAQPRAFLNQTKNVFEGQQFSLPLTSSAIEEWPPTTTFDELNLPGFRTAALSLSVLGLGSSNIDVNGGSQCLQIM